jgi:hypothetical protein
METRPNVLLFTKAFYSDYGLLVEIAAGFLEYTENPYTDPPKILKTVSRNTIRASLLWHTMGVLEGILEDFKNTPFWPLFSPQDTELTSRTFSFNKSYPYPFTKKLLPIDYIKMLGALYVGIGFLDNVSGKLVRRYMRNSKVKKAYEDDHISRDFGLYKSPAVENILNKVSEEELKSLPEPSNLFQTESEAQREKGDLAIIDFKKIVTLSPSEVLAPIDWDHKAIDDLLQNLLQP